MMLTLEKFYTDYDNVAPTIFEPYNRFMHLGAQAIPKDVKKICDLGIGTGNLSAAILKYIPDVKIIGIDRYGPFAEKAESKVAGLSLHIRDIFDGPLPAADYFVSALTTHHFETPTRRDQLEMIARKGRGFVNFDIMLCDGLNLDGTIDLIVEYAWRTYPCKDTMCELRNAIKEHDNPMPFEEHIDLLRSIGMKVDVLGKENPFVVYHASWPTKN
ncbi:class I SAM-dependent methyltransferase [Candidatus Pacearchaeota archaeon]|nr:class I SAM-dependent methyltransferase [Candidatus Pacearchaeota archaeon]